MLADYINYSLPTSQLSGTNLKLGYFSSTVAGCCSDIACLHISRVEMQAKARHGVAAFCIVWCALEGFTGLARPHAFCLKRQRSAPKGPGRSGGARRPAACISVDLIRSSLLALSQKNNKRAHAVPFPPSSRKGMAAAHRVAFRS